VVPPKDGFIHSHIYKPKGLEENIKDVYKFIYFDIFNNILALQMRNWYLKMSWSLTFLIGLYYHMTFKILLN